MIHGHWDQSGDFGHPLDFELDPPSSVEIPSGNKLFIFILRSMLWFHRYTVGQRACIIYCGRAEVGGVTEHWVRL